MTNSSEEFVQKIMALVDENPSEPFSFERRSVEDQLNSLICQYTQEVDDELDTAFDLGVDTGRQQMQEELTDDFESRLIEQKEELLEEFESSKREAYEEGYSTGFEAAKLEY